MGKEEVVDWDQEVKVEKIVSNFKMGIKEGELAAKLARFHELKGEIEIMEESLSLIRKELLEAGKGEESITAGGYAAFFKVVAGRTSCDWKRAYKDAVGEMPEADVKKYITKGEESIRMEVKRIGG